MRKLCEKYVIKEVNDLALIYLKEICMQGDFFKAEEESLYLLNYLFNDNST